MSAGWLVYALVTGALISLAAAALEGVFRSRRWPARWIWAASMTATLVVVAGAARSTPNEMPRGFAGGSMTTMSPATSTGSALRIMVGEARAIAESAMLSAMTTVSRWLPAWVANVAALLWLAGAIAGLATLALVHLRLRRVRKSWPSTVLHGCRVLVAPTVGPAVVGIVRPEIVVPQWLLERAADEQRLVLAHEDEHVRARDHLLLGGACLAVALMPWHPAAWWSLARLRLALELDCDARVLRRGAHARSYGEMLIDLAGQCSGFRVGATALADKTTHLERRLLAMRPKATRFTLLRAAALCSVAALALAAACEARVPTSAEIQSMDAASAKSMAEKSGLLGAQDHAKMEFYVNDARVSATEAHAIPASDIATVNLQKGTDGMSVRIRTLAVGANGLTYRDGASGAGVAGTASSGLKALHEKLSSSSNMFDGVVVIDGTRADASALHRLDPKDIVSVEVIKGAQALQMMPERAARNGIIKVTTTGKRVRG